MSSGFQELAETIGRVNGMCIEDSIGGGRAEGFGTLPPPIDFAGDSDADADAAVAREEGMLVQLSQLFPDREIGNLRSVIRKSNTLDDAIDQVIASEPIEPVVTRRHHGQGVRGSREDATKRQSVMLRPPTEFVNVGDLPPPPPTIMNSEAQLPPPVSAPRPKGGRLERPITAVSTDDGFLDCPPPPDFVLNVNKVMWDGPSDPDDPRFAPIKAPPRCSIFEETQVMDNDDDDNDDAFPTVFNAADEPVVVRPPQTKGKRGSRSRSITNSPASSVDADVRGRLDRNSSAAVVSRVANRQKTPPPSKRFSGFGNSEFDGFDSDGFGSDLDDFVDEAIDVSPRRPRSLRKETAIPATDEELRQTVEDLVESKLRRANSLNGGRGSNFSDTDSVRSESVASTVSVDALSEIVAQTVDRLLKDPRYQAGDDPRDSGRHSWNSRGSRDSRTSLGSRGSAGSPPVFDDDVGEQIYPGIAYGGPPQPARDSRYIAGSQTMDQLRHPTTKVTVKARAREQIRRLVSGRGAPLTGQRIFVHRDVRLGFGFSVSGESPSYVNTVIPHGPADNGLDGLLPGDVIMKINDRPVATSSRDVVLSMIESVPVGEMVVIVVARTPPSQRKRFNSDPGESTRSLHSPLVSYSGWLHMMSNENGQIVWQRRWVVLGDQKLHYYTSPDGDRVTPLGKVPLGGACCCACGKTDGLRRDAAFKLEYKNAPAVYLCAPSSKTMWEWIRRLNLVAKTC